MAFITTQQVHGTSFPGEHLTGTLDFWTVTTTVNILNDTSGNPLSNNQRALDALIQTFSMNTQPVIMGAVVVGSITSSTTGLAYQNGGAVMVADVYQGVITGVEVLEAGTGFPSATAAPTVAFIGGGGTGATATSETTVVSAVVGSSGGSGYVVGDTLSVAGGTAVTVATLTVTAVAGGVITAVAIKNGGLYTTSPSLTNNAVTGGSGSSATMNLLMGIGAIVVSAGGSGYTAPVYVNFSANGVSGGASVPTYTIRLVNEHDTAWTPYNNANSVTLDTAINNVYNVGFAGSAGGAAQNIVFAASGTQYSSAYPGSANLGLVNGSTSF